MSDDVEFDPATEQDRIPFGERLTCSVDDAVKVSGLGRSMIYNKMKSGEIEWNSRTVFHGPRRMVLGWHGVNPRPAA